MSRLEQKREPETAAMAPMDSDSKPPGKDALEGESIQGEKESLRESGVVRDHAEQQSRNSEIMRELD